MIWSCDECNYKKKKKGLYGLVHKIESKLFPIEAEFISIGEPIQQIPSQGIQQIPQSGNFTKSFDL
jgi:hypothetical protein